MTTGDEYEAAWADPANWRAGGVYRAPRDPRVWVPKRNPALGWTLNFARRRAWAWLAALLAGPVAVAVWQVGR